MRTHQVYTTVAQFILLLFLAACTAEAAESAEVPKTPEATAVSTEPRIFFTNIEDGDTVSSPVLFQWGSENFTIEPYGNVDDGPIVHVGAGHLHILIDAPCVKAGEQIRNPSDGSQIHYLLGQTEGELKLMPGEHTLCLQAGNGAHIALPGDNMRVVINIFVAE